MILKALKYTRFEGEPREWKIVGKGEPQGKAYAEFGNLNLLVGKNASGKSRTLNVIREIGNLLTGRHTVENTPYPNEKYELIFSEGDNIFEYHLSYKSRIIEKEELVFNGKKVLNRADIKENLSPTTPAIISIKNTYTDSILEWGIHLKSFMFSNQYEKHLLVKDYTILESSELNAENTEHVIYTFYKGVEQFEEEFTDEIVQCMQQIGYPISDVNIQNVKGRYGLVIEEEGKYQITQREMSHGMFRALAMFIQLIYAQKNNIAACVLLDDIGEGIDYDRSKDLISLVIKKINNSELQFFMTTNDRNIMNKIPLRYWTIIDRIHEDSFFYNYQNSKEVFEDFKYTGLNNFDFLATDFYKNGFGENEEDNATDFEDNTL